MYAKPDFWTGVDRIQWGCVLMRMLGESSLESLPLVLSGLRSVECSFQAAPHQTAIRTARALLGDLLTKRGVQAAVFDFLSTDRVGRSFEFAPDSLTFRQRDSYDPAVARAEAILRRGLDVVGRTQDVANTSRDLVAHLSGEGRVRIRLNNLRFPPPRQHDLDRRPCGRIEVTWEDLRDLADDLDATDETAGGPSADWRGRLENAALLATTGSGLGAAGRLLLDGLKHLLGLPGSGKTTLISLICVLLARRGLRVAVFFTAIQVAREYLETLRRYGVRSALLVGRAPNTHLRHANELAELVSADGQGGFGRTREGVDLLAQSCALPAFAEAWPGDNDWSFGEAPCEALFEPDSRRPVLCPAWELCSRVKNQRELVAASVWLGHILSADTLVPAHTSREQLRYFELAARTFDLVIVDECDETQKMLDDHGALTLKLTGDDQSVHMTLQQAASLLAANRARVSDPMLRHLQFANEFERHTLRFVAEIRRLQRDEPRLARRYEEKLLTATYLLGEALQAAKREEAFTPPARGALSDLWETAMYSAFFERDAEESVWRKAARHAPQLGRTLQEGQQIWSALRRALGRYLALDHAVSTERPVGDVIGLLADLIGAPDTETVASHVRLLVAVGFTIASYQRLAKNARPLAQRGELDADDLVFSKASTELRLAVPRSILGTFSSIRFRQATEKGGLEIDYLVMDSTPRVLLHRLHERGGANVLLASATSWLAPSSQFHVDQPPDYVLVPRTPQQGRIRLYFQPKVDPLTHEPLRFSGAGYDREKNLRAMVDQLARPGPAGSSDLERIVRTLRSPLGNPRKAALAVNSYEQVRLVVEHIHAVNPELGRRTRGIVPVLPTDHSRSRYALRGQVEALGADADVDALVFPIGALGRGVNIVFTAPDDDNGCAAIGSLFFLTRPHPAAGDLSLMLSLLARETQRLDGEDLRSVALPDVQKVFDRRRFEVYRRVAKLLARPMTASQLDAQTLRAFAANLLVVVLQTIGRATRKSMPAEIYFVDAAWAPNSARGKPDDERSSVLVGMRDILMECVTTGDADQRDIYRELYGVFESSFRALEGVVFPSGPLAPEPNGFEPSPAGLEDAMDGWEPDDTAALDALDGERDLFGDDTDDDIFEGAEDSV